MWKIYLQELIMAAANVEKLATANIESSTQHRDHNNITLQLTQQQRNGYSRSIDCRPLSSTDHSIDCTTLQQHINEIIVLPSPEFLHDEMENQLDSAGGGGSSSNSSGGGGGGGSSNKFAINDALRNFTEALRAKIIDCQKIVAKTSVVSFTVNFIESRILSNELGSKLVKLYELLEVHSIEEFEKRLDNYATGVGADNSATAVLVADLRLALEEWELYLTNIERQLDHLIGPEKAPDLDSTDDIHLVSHNKMFRSSTLLSYLKKSAYEMIFLEIVTSFLTPDCYQHVKLMFESLGEFQKNNCDILLLTKRPTQGGGGFLKLIGIPFRILLNEKESLKQLLAHRRSVLLLAGVRAVHGYAEFASNEHAFEVDDDVQRRAIVGGLVERAQSIESTTSGDSPNSLMQNAEARSLLGSESGCALVNRRGHILYSHVCQNHADWPDINELLEHVKKHQSQRNASVVGSNGTANNTSAANTTTSLATTTDETDDDAKKSCSQPITVYRRKCCVIL